MTSRRLVTFGGITIAVESEGSATSSVVDFLFGDMDETAGHEPATSFEVRPVAAGMLRLSRAGVLLNECDTTGGIAAHLACEVAREIAEVSSAGMLYHAAVVAWGRCGVVLPGGSGSGKTTLSAHLVQQGFSYLSDELAFVPFDAMVVDGFGRPLSLKPGAWPALEIELAAAPDASEVLVSGDGFLVRPVRLNRMTARSRPALGAIVLPRRETGAAASLRRLTKAEAAMALLANFVNARNLPDHGLAHVTRLARTVPAYEAVYDDARTIVPAIRSVIAASSAES